MAIKHDHQYRVGTCGFHNKHWKGIFYPEKLAQRKWFEFYCEKFNSLEINTTFYRFPTAARLNLWYAKSAADFTFSVKAPRLITHFNQFNNCERLLDEFYTACRDGLREKLGCTLFQLPARLVYSKEKLSQILFSLDPAFHNVIEFRDASWWNPEVYDALAENNITFCSISHPKYPTDLIANTAIFYLRLHGDEELYFSDYTSQRLKVFDAAIHHFHDLSSIYVYFNNTASEAGVLNALEFKLIIESNRGISAISD